MARKDYIDKINKNMEKLTKDELKDVATLTNVQFGVRLKVAEKEYWEKEVEAIKSKLQQQDLPVVPECVGEWYEEHKDDLEHGIYSINVSLNKTAIGELTDVERRFNDVSNEPNETIFIMKRLGYEVEKPQLFYLKHIDMSKHSRYFDFYLEYDGNESMEHKRVDKGEKPGTGYEKSYYTFTQQEIDSMQTGSYEQIEVAE